MSKYVWPLQSNRIRKDIPNNSFGANVRNNHTRDHQGWDLIASPLTACYAIADGEITVKDSGSTGYGLQVYLKFDHFGIARYAMYAHLSVTGSLATGNVVKQGDIVGYTGRSGNASKIDYKEAHLHFEIRTSIGLGHGMTGRINPADLFGAEPMGYTVFEAHGQKLIKSGGQGLKISAAEMRKWN